MLSYPETMKEILEFYKNVCIIYFMYLYIHPVGIYISVNNNKQIHKR